MNRKPTSRRTVVLRAACIFVLLALAALTLAAWSPWTNPTQPLRAYKTPGETHSVPAASAPPWFRNVAAEAALDFTYRNGEEANRYTLLESVGGGVGLIDYDRDGWLDVALAGGGQFDEQGTAIRGLPTRLFRNLGNGKYADVTSEVLPEQPEVYSHGCAVADFDCDGWLDLLVTGYGRLVLYHNRAAGMQGRLLADVTEPAGLTDAQWSTSAAFADLSGDGFPELYVCHYADWSFANDPVCAKADTPHGRDVCPPQRFQPLPDALYHNQGNGTFRDVTAEQGVRADGFGLGVLACDLDDDRRPDVYVGNDATANYLYWNREGRLEERGGEAGVAFDENGEYDGSMGVDAGDFDGSGRAALWVTNFQEENHALYASLGRGLFRHISRPTGIAALGRRYVGFGTGFFDADNDSWEDLFIANGHVIRYPRGASFRQTAVLLHNTPQPPGRFLQNVSDRGGEYFERELLGRGVALGDLDNDGWCDLVVSHSNSPVALLRNEGARQSAHHWLGIELVGKRGRDVTGSTVTLEIGGRPLTRYAKGGGSYLSSSDRRLLFGLGSATSIGPLTVHWSWGNSERWSVLALDRYHRLVEGESPPTAGGD